LPLGSFVFELQSGGLDFGTRKGVSGQRINAMKKRK
jgi:hypothetical protein